MSNFFKLLVSTTTVLTFYSQDVKAQVAKPTEIQITAYRTTIFADGKDEVLIVAKLIDNKGNEVSGVSKPVSYKVSGDAKIISINGVNAESMRTDTTWKANLAGKANIILKAGKSRSIIKFKANGDSLREGATEIHSIQPGKPTKVTTASYKPKTISDKILGADISFLPQNEARGAKYSDNGVEKDALVILKDHGINYIRIRLFNNPSQPRGYSPNRGFCDLENTKKLAKRVKAAGMKFLLDFHYSDNWADPQQQRKPLAWVGKDFAAIKDSVEAFTKYAMQQLKDQGTEPDMVQVGNEVNHGMIWPDGHINNLDSLAQLFYAGFKGVKAVSPNATIMLHVALGGQIEESEFFYDAMAKRNVPYDIIGLSYYPKWHGTPEDLKKNMAALSKKYNRQIMVAEYSQMKPLVNEIAFTVPGGKGIGSFIWEPLSWGEAVFDRTGKSNEYLHQFTPISEKYLK
ncbi:glycosyl hydrolase 53 family protein [Paradesertivirga mongoliensis]|uniref:Arabinogalactan endo-beta-1,4-galactanase n=1 Tax=Paradesertivirga mongoliensis TaxID=2100740 RepID=A0ABW4ZS29_9SPHI|nr:glycosyl hydrolase 53 family protein [Pedobacter mongoliensis]